MLTYSPVVPVSVCPTEVINYCLCATETAFSVCYTEYEGVHISENCKVLHTMDIQSKLQLFVQDVSTIENVY